MSRGPRMTGALSSYEVLVTAELHWLSLAELQFRIPSKHDLRSEPVAETENTSLFAVRSRRKISSYRWT